MLAALQRLLRHALYALRGGFLVRPVAIAAALALLGVLLPWVEETFPVLDHWAEGLPVLVARDAATAQGILGAIIGAVMTVVSIVLSVLLVALTLASMQFSPRILTGFVEDEQNQRTIGLFLGTFLYCLCVYPAAAPPRGPPALALLGAMALAGACAVALVAFVYHIARSINVSFITERIANETERVVDDVMPDAVVGRVPLDAQPVPAFDGPAVPARASGYIRFIDIQGLRALAIEHGVALFVERRVGQFIPEGAPLFRFSRAKDSALAIPDAFLDHFDIGAVRTMEQDIEFGVLQLVDIALKAISPAVNDPSTAINCIDQISRVLVRIAGREPAPAALYDPPGVVRVVLHCLTFPKLLEVAFSQIVHYGKTDVPVMLRVVRAIGDVASVTRDPAHLLALRVAVERVAAVCAGALPPEGEESFRERLDAVRARTGGGEG